MLFVIVMPGAYLTIGHWVPEVAGAGLSGYLVGHTVYFIIGYFSLRLVGDYDHREY